MFYDFITKNTDFFFCWKKIREAFALQKLLTFFQHKYWHIWDINVWNFNETLTNDVISFEQPGPDVYNNDVILYTIFHVECFLASVRAADSAVTWNCIQTNGLL